MSKHKTKGQSTLSRRFVEQLSRAEELLDHGKAAEALVILERLHQLHPNQPEALIQLTRAYHDLHDLASYERALRSLTLLKPHSPDIALTMAGAFLVNDRPVLALRAFQEFLHHWPGHPAANDARKAVVALEKQVRELIKETGLDEQAAEKLLVQHEELRFCLANGQFQQGQRIAEKLLRLHPNFIPALNNLGQIYAALGEINQAIEMGQQVLALQPDNVHALSNLARLHFLGGRPLEAQQFAARLKASPADAAGRWTKIAEALTFLGDDEGVLALYQPAKSAGDLDSGAVDEIFYHLLAVSACRLGRVRDARRYWKQAQRINQNYDWARQNLADLDKPPEKRHGPWAWPFENWMLGASVRELSLLLEQKKSAKNKAGAKKVVGQFLEKHPEIIFLAPHLIERGDEKACEFVFRLAAASGHPELLSVAKSFLTGQRGSMDLRMHCAQVLSEAELLPSGPIRLWTGNAWSDTLMLNIDIDPTPEKSKLPRAVEKLSHQAWEALQERNGLRAQAALEEALSLKQDDPLLLNNLALAYELQGQIDKAHQMIYEIHSRFPDYFFGIVGVVRLAIADGNLEHASELLDRLMQRKKMHPSEFNVLCMAEIELCLADGKLDAARSWIEMWERVDPKNPEIPGFRRRIGNRRR
jgi:Flp pilus assembly protein TadD